MAIDLYTAVINSDDGNTYYDRPRKLTMPTEDYKYITVIWLESYTITGIANITYGSPELYYLILESNKTINPLDDLTGRKIRLLMPKYISEVA